MADSRSLSERLSKMPPGRHLVPRDFVAQNQRERMLLATAELVAERGYQKTTIELIAKTARVALSPSTSSSPARRSASSPPSTRAWTAAAEVFAELLDPEQPWAEQISTGLEIFLEMVVTEPARARLCIVEAPGGRRRGAGPLPGDAGEGRAEAARGPRATTRARPAAGRPRGGDRRRPRLAGPPAAARRPGRRHQGPAAGDAAGDADALRRRGRGRRARRTRPRPARPRLEQTRAQGEGRAM